MKHFDLFCTQLRSIVRVVECNLSRRLTMLRADSTEVKVNSTVLALYLVLDEEGDFDVSVFEKLVHLLAKDLVVICLVVLNQS